MACCEIEKRMGRGKPRWPWCSLDGFSHSILHWRLTVILTCLLVAAALATGSLKIGFSTDFRVFFGPDNPHLAAYNALQDTYQKADNILVVLAPEGGAVFTAPVLTAIRDLTERSWKLPYVTRVDSLANFQHSEARNDDVQVAPLIARSGDIDTTDVARARRIAMTDPLLAGRLVARDGATTAVNLLLTLPEDDLDAVPEAISAARALVEDARERNPGIRFAVTGNVPLNYAFVESAQRDLRTLYPIVYAVVFLGILVLFPYGAALIGSTLVIGLSAAGTVGLAGWFGVALNPVSAVAPLIVTTVATADIIHLLTAIDGELERGATQKDAIRSALRLNFLPIFLTSITTVIGFLSLNASDAPPFHHLGNMAAAGITIAWLLSITLFPALLGVMPPGRARLLQRFRGFELAVTDRVIARPRLTLVLSCVVTALLAAAIPRIDLDDQFVRYFSPSLPFRADTEFTAQNLTGIYQLEFSIDAGEAGAIAEPGYLERLDSFARWLRAQPEVMHVQAWPDVIKRLNRNMHGDDDRYYRLPETRELAAQYLLLFEMSLPQGLDLRNQVNIDRSQTRLIATLQNLTTHETQALAARAEQWLQANFPSSASAEATGPAVMFSHIYETNIRSMLKGTAVALVLISVCLALALRSLRLGLLSLIPNIVPAVLMFGIWALLIGRVGLAAAVVTAVTLGIIVDNTIHFVTKFQVMRRLEVDHVESAVRRAFAVVGPAVLTSTIVLLLGFGVLSLSSFQASANLGAMSAIAILLSLVADMTILPALLLVFGKAAARNDGIAKEEWRST